MTSEGRCGAAALLQHVRNPISLARAVMERTPHAFLVGSEAEVTQARARVLVVGRGDTGMGLSSQLPPYITVLLMRSGSR
jgi:isoaspartyl peptidase/L-asparaginase-like protein (Ntn-hydrolase superfamily)